MAVLLVKGLKPRKLNIEQVRQNILRAMEKEGKAVIREYEKTVNTWNNKPSFEALVDLDGNDAVLVVGPTGNADAVQHFVWTDEGTRPHVIQARNAPTLVFQTGYSPKTLPGKIDSYPAGRFGEFVRPVQVNHPGTKARRFTEIIQQRRRKPFIQAVIKAARLEYGA